MKKILKILLHIFIITICLFIFISILDKYIPNHYSYIGSIEYKNKRYSLYKELFTFWNGWVIFEHDINYNKYKKVKKSKLSLEVYNNNLNDKFIYYYFPRDINYENAKIEIFKNRYLVLSFNWMYNFLYDFIENKKYNDRNSKEFFKFNIEEINNNIMEIIGKIKN